MARIEIRSLALALAAVSQAEAQRRPSTAQLEREVAAEVASLRKLSQEMVDLRPRLEAPKYDPSRYSTYMEQMGIEYPAVRR
jgi:hypothetical protein